MSTLAYARPDRASRSWREPPGPDRADDTFPVCRLHGCRLVCGFPEGCFLAAPNPLWALWRFKDAAYRVLWREDEVGDRALADLKIYDACGECVHTGALAHPHIRHLRRVLLKDRVDGATAGREVELAVEAVAAGESRPRFPRRERDGGNGDGSRIELRSTVRV